MQAGKSYFFAENRLICEYLCSSLKFSTVAKEKLTCSPNKPSVSPAKCGRCNTLSQFPFIHSST